MYGIQGDDITCLSQIYTATITSTLILSDLYQACVLVLEDMVYQNGVVGVYIELEPVHSTRNAKRTYIDLKDLWYIRFKPALIIPSESKADANKPLGKRTVPSLIN